MCASSDQTPHPRAVLAIILISCLVIILDTSIVMTGLQSIETLAFGGFLLLGARAGDILERRKTFQAGLVIFTVASALIGVAH